MNCIPCGPSDNAVSCGCRDLAQAGREFLVSLGHEAAHVRALGLERSADRVLVAHARLNALVILTFDLDFGDILALGVLDKPSVIILRLDDERADSVNRHVSAVVSQCADDLESGALVLIEDARYRVRKLPIGRT